MLLDRAWDLLCGSVPIGSVGHPGAETVSMAAWPLLMGYGVEGHGTRSPCGHHGHP